MPRVYPPMEPRGQSQKASDPMRCQCGYKLVNGQCPIPCNGKPLREQPAPTEQKPAIYWTPKEAAA